MQPRGSIFRYKFLGGVQFNFELLLIEYRVPGEHRLIYNIGRSNTNMHNSNFKGFACVRAKGTNLNFGWGSIQERGCIQASTVVISSGYQLDWMKIIY